MNGLVPAIARAAPVGAARPPEPDVPVRVATAADEPEIVRLLHMMHGEGGMLPLSESHAREVFARAFNRQGGIIGVVGPSNDIRAMIYLLITRFWYTGENHLEELFNYVRPDSRKNGFAGTLIRFAKQCSDEIKIPLAIGVLTNHRMAEKVRLYRRYLGPPAGAFFVYGATWANEPADQDFWQVLLRKEGHFREVTPGSRVVSLEVLRRLGGGDAERGRALLDTFLAKSSRNNSGQRGTPS